MCVRKDHRIHLARIMRKVQIPFISFASSSLIQPAVEQETMPIDLQQMLASSHSLCRAVKIDPQFSLLQVSRVAFHTAQTARENPPLWTSDHPYSSVGFLTGGPDILWAG